METMDATLRIEVTPSASGDTAFASMYAALQTLSRPMLAFLAGCSAVHAGDMPFRGAYKALHPAFGVVGLLSPDAFRLARDDGRRTALPRTACAARHWLSAVMGRKGRYHVYVIALSDAVLQEPRFLKSNPGYVSGKPCVYVGMTGLDPDLRFDKHMAGIQANRYVLRHGLRLLPDLYEAFNPMTRDQAQLKEVDIAIDLRSAGFGVWQA